MRNPQDFIKVWKFKNGYKYLFEAGPMFFSDPLMTEKYFVDRVCNRRIQSKFKDFYDFHLAYYFSKNPNGEERLFFKFVLEVVDTAITNYKNLNKASANRRRHRLQDFRDFLLTVDQWNLCKLSEDEKDRKIIELTAELKSLRKSYILPENRIELERIGVKTFIDIVLQIQELKNPENGAPYFSSPVQKTWARIISNMCIEGGKEIKEDSVYSYFKEEGKPVDGVRFEHIL